MNNGNEISVWLYARSGSPHLSAVISKMHGLAEEADRRSYCVAGASHDRGRRRRGHDTGLSEMCRAIRTGRANAVLIKSVSQLSTRYKTALCILQFLQEHGAVLLCAESDVRYELHILGLAQPLRRRALKRGCGLPWL